ncbi:hypothetical protein [Xanthobacter sp. ZOL 2024]
MKRPPRPAPTRVAGLQSPSKILITFKNGLRSFKMALSLIRKIEQAQPAGRCGFDVLPKPFRPAPAGRGGGPFPVLIEMREILS